MTERDIAAKLLSSGLTLFGILIPVLITILIIGSDPSIGSNYKNAINLSMIYFVPGIIGISIQMFVCLLIISGRLLGKNLAIWLTALVIAYLACGIVAFSIRMIWV